MIAKCSRCQNAFSTERHGRQFCPTCGAEVYLPAPGEDPRAGAGGESFVQGAPVGGGAMPPGSDWQSWPQDQDCPFDRRAELGFFDAMIETLKGSMLSPGTFFDRMKTDDTTSAFLYAWLTTAVGTFFGQLWQTLLQLAVSGGRQETPELIGQAVGLLIGVPIGAAVGVWIAAGIVHVGCSLFKCADRGFSATFRSVAYAQGPQLLAIIPFLGQIVGGIWVLVIEIYALSRLQRTTPGRAAAAILVPGAVLAACCCGVIFAAIAAGATAAGLSR